MSKPRRKRTPPPTKLDSGTLHAIEEAAERAAKRAVSRAVRDFKKILVTLGLNAESPEAQIETQKDTAFLRRIRTAFDTRASKLGYAVFAALLSLIVGLITFALNYFYRR